MLGVLETLKLAYGPKSKMVPDTSDEPLPPKPEQDSQVDAAAYGAAVGHVINRPDGIRSRAQVSATISAAVAAALAAFAPLKGLAAHSVLLQAPVVAAIVAWLVSLWRYLQVISLSYHSQRKTIEDAVSDKTDERRHLRRFMAYAALMRAAVERGTAATTVAVALTILAALAVALEPLLPGPEKPTRVLVDGNGFEALDALCDNAVARSMVAKTRPQDLRLKVVPLRFDEGKCMPGKEAVVHLPREWIVTARQDG
jgi:hypothetical protein